MQHYKSLANHPTTPIDSVELSADLIFDYELREKRERHEALLSLQQPQMGIITDWHRAAKAHLKVETQCATNHGAEVNNPFPEKLTWGNYAVHLPDSSVIILKNEKEICQFINQQRTLGFPLDVNPKWGWEINQEGILFVPDTRFDWQFVHEELALLHKTIESQEDELAQKISWIWHKV